MTTISVPLPADLEKSLNHLIKSGYGSNKADVVRKAIIRLAEEEALESVLLAQREIKSGKGLKGDLRELARKIK